MTPAEIIRLLGGVARWNEIECLVTRAQLEAQLADGSISRVRRGTYALGNISEVRALAEQVGGTVSHLSAALEHGWKVKFPPAKPTITLGRNRSLPSGELADVFWSDLTPLQAYRGLTRPVATVIGCARAYPYDVALSVADSACASRL